VCWDARERPLLRRQPSFWVVMEIKCPASRVAAGQVDLIVNPRTSQENFTSVIELIAGRPASSTSEQLCHRRLQPRPFCARVGEVRSTLNVGSSARKLC
jgi:hypothetical protein